jgi:hypothetical protein
MGNELKDEFEISQPWQRASGRGAAPGLKTGEGAEGVRPHPGIGEMLEGGHITVAQDFGVAIA